ncbi:hypothetical protein EYS14_24445 [Alteromonadaceae bacterium M269]|nr:hypothetical protein EYS14_24445 [Alteromonadaceae bacterium M269]
MKYRSYLLLFFLPLTTLAQPETPSLLRDVHMTEKRRYINPTIPALQTSADARIGLSHRQELMSDGSNRRRVAFRLLKPEKLRGAPFLNSDPGTTILDAENALAPESATFTFADNPLAPGEDHIGLCDASFNESSPVKNPRACGADDCYDLNIISAPRMSPGGPRRLQSAPVVVRVSNPKSANASIADVTFPRDRNGDPIVNLGATFDIQDFLEPMVAGGGRLLTFRQGRTHTIPPWTDSTGRRRTGELADMVYAVPDNIRLNADGDTIAGNFPACDVRQWTQLYPITHAPYDDTINDVFGFAMNDFRDPTGRVIEEGERLSSYPWMDKNADNMSFASYGLNLYNLGTGQPNNGRAPSCVPGTGCNNNRAGNLSSQNQGNFSGRMIMGLWTQGKMVLLDNLINNIDYNQGSADRDHRQLRLYSGAVQQIRIGNGRDNNRNEMPLSSSGNTSFLDTNEHRFNYFDFMTPVTPAETAWLMSSGRTTTEVPFDDYTNINSFLNVNMAQAVRVPRNNFFNNVSRTEVQNAGTSRRWNLPDVGRILGGGRIEPIANGGIKGKGFWLDGNGMGLRFVVPNQPRDVRNSSWHYSLFVDPRSASGNRTLLAFPNGGELRLSNNNNRILIVSANGNVESIDPRINIQQNSWTHIAVQVTPVGPNNRRSYDVETYVNGNRVNTFNANTPPIELTRAGSSSRNFDVGITQAGGTNDFNGWIDEVKIFAEEVNYEVACNRAAGTLVGVPAGSPARFRNMASNRVPADTHADITRILNSNGETSYPQYLCHQDYTGDLAAHRSNIPPALRSVADSINFPEGPLVYNAPRPDSTENQFCLSCHERNGQQGLDLGALSLRRNVNAIDDNRRQPLQPEPAVYGHIPRGWLGTNRPSVNMIATEAAPFLVDACVLNSNRSGGNNPSNCPNQTE